MLFRAAVERMGVFPCAWPSAKMGNVSPSGVRSLLWIWDSLSRSPNSSRGIVYSESDEEEEAEIEQEEEAGTRERAIAPRNFYEKQCRVLEEQLSFAEEISKQGTSQDDGIGSLSSGSLLWPPSALKELRRVLKVGKALVQECHNEPCLRAYLRQSERKQAFVETLKEIVWCMSVVFYYNNIKGGLPENPDLMASDQFPFVKLGAYKELHMLQEAALADRTELLATLNIWIRNHDRGVCSISECGAGPRDEGEDPPFCIAAQILRRRASAAAIEDAPEVDHTSLLWNIYSNGMQGGAHIGAGSFCSVVETSWLGDTYARKIFQIPEAFSNEADISSKLSHRHIVTVSAYSVDSGTCSLLMQRMPYDLRQYIKFRRTLGFDPPFSFSAAIDLMLQVAEAIRYMLSQGIVHRDVKPGNILLEEVNDPQHPMEGFVVAKLADFGVSKLKLEIVSYADMTKNQGSRPWMAPEVFGADADNEEHLPVAYPFKTDVYSFGIVCSEILTGLDPFPYIKPTDRYKLLTDPVNPLRPELPESCPESVASLIRDCWHTDPKRRPPFTEICTMLRHLKALLMLTGDGKVQDWMDRIQFRPAQTAPAEYASPSLFSGTCDGSSWTVDIPWPEDMSNPLVMSVTEHQGALVAIHQRCTDGLFWRTHTGSSWTQPNIIHERFSRVLLSRPTAASFQGRLVCVYYGEDNFVWCTHSADLKNWTQGNSAIDRSIQPVARPTLAAFGDRLISVIRGHDDNLYWNSSSDPTRLWSPYTLIDSGIAVSRTSPVHLVEFNSELYCFVNGSHGGKYGILWSKLSEGQNTWLHPFYRIKVDGGVTFCPTSFTVFENRLVCIGYARPESKLVYGTINIHFSRMAPVMSIATVVVPTNRSVTKVECLWVIQSKLFCVYHGGPKHGSALLL